LTLGDAKQHDGGVASARRRPRRQDHMSDKTSAITGIVDIMQNSWDLPADCNEGELFTYAEILFDRIRAGDSKDALYAYLSGVQVDSLDMPKSDAFKGIVDRSVTLVGSSG
jgi:hypothetical protein